MGLTRDKRSDRWEGRGRLPFRVRALFFLPLPQFRLWRMFGVEGWRIFFSRRPEGRWRETMELALEDWSGCLWSRRTQLPPFCSAVASEAPFPTNSLNLRSFLAWRCWLSSPPQNGQNCERTPPQQRGLGKQTGMNFREGGIALRSWRGTLASGRVGRCPAWARYSNF